MSDDLKSRILEASKLYEIISANVSLHRVGSHHRGLCPFHEEKTPSFYVFSDHYHCFGCGAHGDAIEYAKRYHGLNFIEALKWLAHKAGIDASELSLRGHSARAKNAAVTLQNILSESHHIFTQELWKKNSPRSHKALEYLTELRGFSEAFLKKHDFGLSFSEGQTLYQILKKQGFKERDLLQSSLISPYKSTFQDFFQSRIIFPIDNHQGKLIAFAGRVFGEKPNEFPKYKNSRYNKASVLYGFHRARDSIRSEKRALICEGYMDALRLSSADFHSAVACQGTALTLSHLKSLCRITNRITLLFDGDNAGEQAAFRTLSSSLSVPEIEIFRARLPQGEDPDSFLKNHSRQDFEHLLANSKPLLEDMVLSKLKTTPSTAVPGMLQKEYLPWIKSLPSTLQQETMLIKISELTGISHSTLKKELHSSSPMKPLPEKPTDPAPKQETLPTLKPLDPLEEELLTHLFYATPEDHLQLEELKTIITEELEIPPPWMEYFLSFLHLLKQGTSPASLPQEDSGFWQNHTLREKLLEKKGRYLCASRSGAIELILKRYRQLQIKKKVTSLKKDLLKSTSQPDSGDSWKEVARAIESLQQNLRETSHQSSSPGEDSRPPPSL